MVSFLELHENIRLSTPSPNFRSFKRFRCRLYQCRKETWPEPCGASGFDNYRVAPLPELSDLQFTQVRLLAHDSVARVPLSSFPDGAEVPTLITDGLLFKTDATSPPFARSIDAVLGTLGSFRWAAPLQTAMDRYVDTSFGPDPFVAIHWRRGYSDNVFTVRTAEEVATELHDWAIDARSW